MSRDRRHTTALVERMACVREVQAKQRLSDALAQENEQRLLAEASAGHLQDTEQGLMRLFASEKLDLSRTGLYQDLASAQQIMLANDQKVLKAREETRTACADELTRKTHYRDGASLRAHNADRAHQLMEERKEVDGLIESWVLRGLRMVPHE